MVFCLGRTNCIRSGRQGMDGRPSNLLKSNILDRGNNPASVILAARAPQGSIEFPKSQGAAKSAPDSLESYPVLQVPKAQRLPNEKRKFYFLTFWNLLRSFFILLRRAPSLKVLHFVTLLRRFFNLLRNFFNLLRSFLKLLRYSLLLRLSQSANNTQRRASKGRLAGEEA